MLPALALAPSGCLVTESPSFDVAQAVPPKIVPVTPPALVIRATKKGFHYDVPSFKFRVVSEEVDNKNLLSVLLIDYGTLGPDGSSPWSDPQDGDVITPGKLSDGPRPSVPKSADWPASTQQWNPDNLEKRSCHTVTLLVTHEFSLAKGRRKCPLVPDDVDTVTWTVVLCNELPCDIIGCPLTATTFCDTPVVTP